MIEDEIMMMMIMIMITTTTTTINNGEKLVDIEQSYRWLKSGNIKGGTESTIVVAQDQAISTNYFKNKTLMEETESKYWLCK
jgi:hypothetical protein